MRRALPVIVAALLASACATAPTLYAPAAGPRAIGFSDYRIEAGRYRITFRGGPGAPPEQVTDYALLRAADLAIADGYDWFQVTERFVRPASPPSGGSRMSVGIGGGNFGWRSGVGVGLGTSFPIGAGAALIATMEVLMGRGRKPQDVNVYDAREVRGTIGPRT